MIRVNIQKISTLNHQHDLLQLYIYRHYETQINKQIYSQTEETKRRNEWITDVVITPSVCLCVCECECVHLQTLREFISWCLHNTNTSRRPEPMLIMWAQNILRTLFIFDIPSHDVEKRFLKQHSQNVLIMLFILDEHSKKTFLSPLNNVLILKTGHFKVFRILQIIVQITLYFG